MNKGGDLAKRLMNKRGLLIGSLLFAVLALSFGPNALSQTTRPVTDFGAETIQSDESASTVPLPVEMVEESATDGAKPGSVKSKAGVEKTAAPAADASAASAEGTLAAEGQAETGSEGEGEDGSSFLNVKDMEIAALVKLISKRTQRNYILDSSVKGKVTVLQETPVSMEEALKIFDSVLLLKGFTTVPVGNNVWKIIPAKDARQTTIPLLYEEGRNPTDVLVTRLVRLKHTDATELQQVMSQFVSKEGLLNAFAGTNSLIMIDSAANIKRLAELVKELDVPAADQDITIIPVLHAEAADLSDKIKEIMGEDEKEKSGGQRVSGGALGAIAPPPVPPTGTARPPVTSTGSASAQVRRSLPVKIIPDERTNALIVVADADKTMKIRALVEQLDSAIDRSAGRFYVYRLRHADAEEMSEILQQVISGAAGEKGETSEKSSTRGSSISRSRSSGSSRRSPTDDARARLSSALAAAQQRPATGSGQQGSQGDKGKVSLEGEVFVAPDPATNSLIINASRSDYMKVKEVIEALDVQRRQVLVEATILEVTLSKEEGMGIELQASGGNDKGGVVGQTNWGGLGNILSNPAGLSDLTIAAASSGTLTLPGGLVIPSQAALISAVSRNNNVNVLSSPTIVATDNEEAEIIVGENVPFVANTSTDSSNINNTFNSVERQDVGITLRITPQISTGDFVMLKIFVEISNVVPGTRNDKNGPTTTIRTTETAVEVKSKQMIVTGGLISDSVTESTRGVPFFQDIPVLGEYFKRQDLLQRRTNLLVFITPRIIMSHFDARENTKEFAGGLEKAMGERPTDYPRTEVLRNDKMDNVVELQPTGDVLPTKITPPRMETEDNEGDAALKRTEERLKKLLQTEETPQPARQSVEPKGSAIREDDEVIEVTVSPRLPGVSAKDAAQSRPALSPRANLAEVPRTYVVLKDLRGRGSTGGSAGECRYADDEGTVGLALAGDLNSPQTQYFEVGGRYKLRVGEGVREFVCLGLYGSLGEAKLIHPSLAGEARWNYLSAEETQGLATGPWRRG